MCSASTCSRTGSAVAWLGTPALDRQPHGRPACRSVGSGSTSSNVCTRMWTSVHVTHRSAHSCNRLQTSAAGRIMSYSRQAACSNMAPTTHWSPCCPSSRSCACRCCQRCVAVVGGAPAYRRRRDARVQDPRRRQTHAATPRAAVSRAEPGPSVVGVRWPQRFDAPAAAHMQQHTCSRVNSMSMPLRLQEGDVTYTQLRLYNYD